MKSDRTRFAVLGCLSQGPMSGYEIERMMAESTEFFWSESVGQIYPALRDLETEKAVTLEEKSDEGRQRRRATITPEGRRQLAEWLDQPPRMQPQRIEILLKVFFGRQAPDGAIVRHIAEFRDEQVMLARRYREISAELKKGMADHPDVNYWLLTLDFGIRQAGAYEAWARAALAAASAGLQNLPKSKPAPQKRRTRPS